MPNYDYYCQECNYAEEIFQKITEPSLELCPKCLKKNFVRRPGGGIGLSFKGNGFFQTDYKGSSAEKSDLPSSNACCPCGKNKNSCVP